MLGAIAGDIIGSIYERRHNHLPPRRLPAELLAVVDTFAAWSKR